MKFQGKEIGDLPAGAFIGMPAFPRPSAWNGRVIGIPIFAIPPAAFVDLPPKVRAHLEAKAQISFKKMMAAEARAEVASRARVQAATPAPRYLSTVISGLALRFNEPIFSYKHGEGSLDLPIVFARGCFDLEGIDVLLVDDHEWSQAGQILASTTDQTLLVQADDRGLAFASSQIRDSAFARQAVANIQGGHVRGASIGFDFVRHTVRDFQGLMCQIVLKGKLGHIALSSSPAFKGSWVRAE